MQSEQHSFNFNTSFAFPIIVLTIIILLLAGINRLDNDPYPSSSDTETTILSNPQKIGEFQLTRTDDTSFTLKNLQDHWTLLYFGDPQHAKSRYLALGILDQVYRVMQPNYPSLQVVYVSLDPASENFSDIRKLINNVNRNFIGATGTKDALAQLSNQIGVSLNDSHPILLINPEGKIKAYIPPSIKLGKIKFTFEKIVRG